MIGPDARLRRRDGFALTDRALHAARGPERDRLLRATATSATRTRARRACATRPAPITAEPARHPARRLPARREDLRDAPAAEGRRRPRRAGHRRHRQPDVPGHRPPHLQRLHEGLHLPEAGAGQHPADRDRRAHRRAALPWGFEIYGLLTRWNPLNVRRPYALPYNGTNVLVVGLGPAGYTLAHYLLNEGFGVVGDRRPEDRAAAAGADRRRTGSRRSRSRSGTSSTAELDERMLDGFGGVSEYGITVRWDKNFLTLLHLTLARRDKLRIYGGIRFGGTLPIEDAWALGFDHIAIAAGAGKPTIIDMKNNLIRGIRKASDFLMALQLTGAFKRDALPNLQVRLPAVVIGGGLTGIDTATELLRLLPGAGREDARALRGAERRARRGRRCAPSATPRSRRSSTSSSTHGRAVRAERARAAAAGEAPDFVPLVRGWGGVTLAYRKQMIDSPAYRLNHEEVIKALEEGHRASSRTSTRREIVADDRDHARGDACSTGRQRQRRAAGAHGARRRRHVAQHHLREGAAGHVRARREAALLPGLPRRARERRRDADAGPGRASSPRTTTAAGSISFYGDNHPRYAGNVVKAMASAKHGYRARRGALRRGDWPRSIRRRSRRATRRGRALVRHARRELLAARRAGEPADADDRRGRGAGAGRGAALPARASSTGCRTSRRWRRAPVAGEPPLLMEGLALTGAWVDKEKGLLSLIALEMGVSSRLCASLKPGEPVVVMGPTGTPTEIPHGETVLLAGGGLGNAVLFSIAKALQATSGNQRHLLRRLQEGRGPLQARGDRGRHRSGDLVHGRRAPTIAPGAAAGRALPRQHRAGDGGLRQGRARHAARAAPAPCRASSPSAPTA